MPTVVSIDDYRPHEVTEETCDHCGRRCVSVRPSSATRWKCSNCHRMNNFIEFACNCGERSFALLPNGEIVCRGCDAIIELRHFAP